MQTKSVLGQAEADTIVEAARAEASKHGWAVAIALVDDGGHPLALARLDGASPVSAYIAIEKARTSALGRRESKAYEDMIRNTATTHSPWYVVPADNKWFTRIVVAAAVIDTLASLGLKYPKVSPEQLAELARVKKALLAEK